MDEAFENLGLKGISDFETDSPEQVAAMDLWNTSARIEQDLRSSDLDWITALRSVQIRSLVDSGLLQLSLFDHQDLAEISHPDYAGEPLIACRNPLLAEQRFRKRQELLAATEKRLDQIVAATRRNHRPLRGKEKIGIAIGKSLGRYKMGKHFQFTISETSFTYERNLAGIAEEAALDGIYVLRTSVAQQLLSAEETVRNYKRLSVVERAFRSLKSVDLKVRPIHHHLANRVRAHVLLCMLAAYVELSLSASGLSHSDSQPSHCCRPTAPDDFYSNAAPLICSPSSRPYRCTQNRIRDFPLLH
jgi:Transposase DDE domain